MIFLKKMTTEKEISIWTRVLLSVMEEKNGKAVKLAEKLGEVLKKRKKGHLLPEIIRKVKTQYSKKHGIKIFLAKNHHADFIEKIKGKALSITGKKAENLEICLDKDIIGGFRVKGSNFLVKASVKDFLNEIKSNIKDG